MAAYAQSITRYSPGDHIGGRRPRWLPLRHNDFCSAASHPKKRVARQHLAAHRRYHLLSDPDARFCELRGRYHESRIIKDRRARDLATQLQALTGQHIVIRDGKAVITAADSHRQQSSRSTIRLGSDSVVRAIMNNNSRRACTPPLCSRFRSSESPARQCQSCRA